MVANKSIVFHPNFIWYGSQRLNFIARRKWYSSQEKWYSSQEKWYSSQENGVVANN